jgi:hypothetical protein
MHVWRRLQKYVMRLGLRALRAAKECNTRAERESSRGKAIFLVATTVITSRWEIELLYFVFLHNLASYRDTS